MISQEAIESLEEWQKEQATSSLNSLATSGVIEAQIAIEESRILHGPDNEPVEELAARLLRFRATKQALESLHDVGMSYRKEPGE